MTGELWLVAIAAALLLGASPSLWRAWRNRRARRLSRNVHPDEVLKLTHGAVTGQERDDRRTVQVVYWADGDEPKVVYQGSDQAAAKHHFYDPQNPGVYLYYVGPDCRGRRRVWPDGRVAREV